MKVNAMVKFKVFVTVDVPPNTPEDQIKEIAKRVAKIRIGENWKIYVTVKLMPKGKRNVYENKM